MDSLFQIGDIVTYQGYDDEWSQDNCIGFPYRITKVWPPVTGVYFYDLITTGTSDELKTNGNAGQMFSIPQYHIDIKIDKP